MESPLRGENLPEFGVRFPDASRLYTPELRALARRTAGELGIALREGVYMYFPGPQYETPAEVRAARILGADAVGMSTAPEVITAGHCGLRVLGFTLLTNMSAIHRGITSSVPNFFSRSSYFAAWLPARSMIWSKSYFMGTGDVALNNLNFPHSISSS